MDRFARATRVAPALAILALAILALAILVLATLALAALIDGRETARAAEREAPVPVVTAKVARGDVPIVLKGLGTVQAYNTATIRSQVTGFLTSVTFVEGSSVAAGAVLATIDPEIYRAKLDQAKAQLQRDLARLSNAQLNLDRNVPLLEKGYATDRLVEDQKAQVAEQAAAVAIDKAAVAYAEAELGFTTLRAPFDGVTGIRLTDVGNLVRPSDPAGIVVVAQLQPVSVIVTVAASDIPEIQTALKRGPVAAHMYDQTGTRLLDSGTLLLIDNQAQTKTGTVQLKANIPNAQRELWPGTFVVAEITARVIKDALTIPADAIQQNDQGTFVYVVGDDGTVRVRPVAVASRHKGLALIGSGLGPGETVVTQGQYRLRPGTFVAEAEPGAVSQTTTRALGLLP
jgi:multidrug efflux system membrane fusion protein